LITLLPIISLLVFGGATLKDFAFALMIGIVSGAYSSIFIAAPLLTAWKEREPEFARRKEQQPVMGDGRADGEAALEAAEEAAAAEPAPSFADAVPAASASAQAKRERRRQRRSARPHGRAR
jgi:SecD/SecF fusion protein